MTTKTMFRQGDIIKVNFDPALGHEEKYYRPALVLSNSHVWRKSHLLIVAPISTTTRIYPTYYQLMSTTEIYGKVLLEQVKAIDTTARHLAASSIVDHVSSWELDAILHRFLLLFERESD